MRVADDELRGLRRADLPPPRSRGPREPVGRDQHADRAIIVGRRPVAADGVPDRCATRTDACVAVGSSSGKAPPWSRGARAGVAQDAPSVALEALIEKACLGIEQQQRQHGLAGRSQEARDLDRDEGADAHRADQMRSGAGSGGSRRRSRRPSPERRMGFAAVEAARAKRVDGLSSPSSARKRGLTSARPIRPWTRKTAGGNRCAAAPGATLPCIWLRGRRAVRVTLPTASTVEWRCWSLATPRRRAAGSLELGGEQRVAAEEEEVAEAADVGTLSRRPKTPATAIRAVGGRVRGGGRPAAPPEMRCSRARRIDLPVDAVGKPSRNNGRPTACRKAGGRPAGAAVAARPTGVSTVTNATMRVASLPSPGAGANAAFRTMPGVAAIAASIREVDRMAADSLAFPRAEEMEKPRVVDVARGRR